MALTESPPLIPPEGAAYHKKATYLPKPDGGGFFGGGNPHRPEGQDIKDLAIVARLERATTSSILKSVKRCLLFLNFLKIMTLHPATA
jgi:hypothetical protein